MKCADVRNQFSLPGGDSITVNAGPCGHCGGGQDTSVSKSHRVSLSHIAARFPIKVLLRHDVIVLYEVGLCSSRSVQGTMLAQRMKRKKDL